MSPTAQQGPASERGPRTSTGSTRLWGTAFVLALFAAGMWFAWLGWDHQYYEVDGVPQGPYRAWQVIGCGAAIAVVAVLACLWVSQATTAVFVLAGAATVGFAVPWSIDASTSDDTGLWAVGLMLLLVGGGTGLTVLLAITQVVTQPRLPATPTLAVCCAATLMMLLVYPPLAIVPLVSAVWVLRRRWLPQRRSRQTTA